ncbi:MAG: TetR family transcriptional regulator [Microthrixaceae bacterium]
MSTTLTLAVEGGWGAVQMREVSARADVAIGTLYRYFPSKENLLVSVMLEQIRALADRLNERPPKVDSRSRARRCGAATGQHGAAGVPPGHDRNDPCAGVGQHRHRAGGRAGPRRDAEPAGSGICRGRRCDRRRPPADRPAQRRMAGHPHLAGSPEPRMRAWCQPRLSTAVGLLLGTSTEDQQGHR